MNCVNHQLGTTGPLLLTAISKQPSKVIQSSSTQKTLHGSNCFEHELSKIDALTRIAINAKTTWRGGKDYKLRVGLTRDDLDHVGDTSESAIHVPT